MGSLKRSFPVLTVKLLPAEAARTGVADALRVAVGGYAVVVMNFLRCITGKCLLCYAKVY